MITTKVISVRHSQRMVICSQQDVPQYCTQNVYKNCIWSRAIYIFILGPRHPGQSTQSQQSSVPCSPLLETLCNTRDAMEILDDLAIWCVWLLIAASLMPPIPVRQEHSSILSNSHQNFISLFSYYIVFRVCYCWFCASGFSRSIFCSWFVCFGCMLVTWWNKLYRGRATYAGNFCELLYPTVFIAHRKYNSWGLDLTYCPNHSSWSRLILWFGRQFFNYKYKAQHGI